MFKSLIEWLQSISSGSSDNGYPKNSMAVYEGERLLFTSEGFFVLNPDQFEVIKDKYLPRDEWLRFFANSIMSPIGYSKRYQKEQMREYQAQIDKICNGLASEYLIKFQKNDGYVPELEKRLFVEDKTRLGLKIVLGAIEWTWSELGDLEFVDVEGPIPSFQIRINNETIFLPSRDIERILIWTTKATIQYPTITVILDLLEPEWTTIDR